MAWRVSDDSGIWPPCAAAEHASRYVHANAHVSDGGQGRTTAVDAHAYPDARRIWPAMVRETRLDRHGGLQCVHRRCEHAEVLVSSRVHLVAAGGPHRISMNSTHRVDQRGVVSSEPLHEVRGRLDVGQQERDVPAA